MAYEPMKKLAKLNNHLNVGLGAADRVFDILDKLIEFSSERGKSVLDLAFAWLLWNKNISSVIAGATKPEQVTSNASTCDWDLSDDEYQQVTAILD